MTKRAASRWFGSLVSSTPSCARHERQVTSLSPRLISVMGARLCGLVPQANSPDSVDAWVAPYRPARRLDDLYVAGGPAAGSLEDSGGLLLRHGTRWTTRLACREVNELDHVPADEIADLGSADGPAEGALVS
jgi:hypothetical protein